MPKLRINKTISNDSHDQYRFTSWFYHDFDGGRKHDYDGNHGWEDHDYDGEGDYDSASGRNHDYDYNADHNGEDDDYDGGGNHDYDGR